MWAAATKAAATEAAPPVDKATAVQPVDDVEEFESEMDAMMVDDDDAPAPSEKPPSPGRMRYSSTRSNASGMCNVGLFVFKLNHGGSESFCSLLTAVLW